MQIREVDISELDLDNAFFHYTSKDNLENISKEGLIPNIGENAISIEKTKKVFFTKGIEGTLILMDSWIRGLIMKQSVDVPGQKFDTPFYKFATFIAKCPIRPNFLINGILRHNLKSNKQISKACHTLKNILNNSVYLILDLKENIDFAYDDIDEIKAGNWDKELLDMIYSYEQLPVYETMEYWNMHTFTNHKVDKEKISLLKYKNHYTANQIVRYLFYKSNLKIKKVPYLYEYMKYLEFIDNNKITDFKINI